MKQVTGGDGLDAGPDAPADVHQALVLQGGQGLPHGGAADAEPLGQMGLAEQLAGFDDAVADILF